jgi:hypothetical protein
MFLLEKIAEALEIGPVLNLNLIHFKAPNANFSKYVLEKQSCKKQLHVPVIDLFAQLSCEYS